EKEKEEKMETAEATIIMTNSNTNSLVEKEKKIGDAIPADVMAVEQHIPVEPQLSARRGKKKEDERVEDKTIEKTNAIAISPIPVEKKKNKKDEMAKAKSADGKVSETNSITNSSLSVEKKKTNGVEEVTSSDAVSVEPTPESRSHTRRDKRSHNDETTKPLTSVNSPPKKEKKSIVTEKKEEFKVAKAAEPQTKSVPPPKKDKNMDEEENRKAAKVPIVAKSPIAKKTTKIVEKKKEKSAPARIIMTRTFTKSLPAVKRMNAANAKAIKLYDERKKNADATYKGVSEFTLPAWFFGGSNFARVLNVPPNTLHTPVVSASLASRDASSAEKRKRGRPPKQQLPMIASPSPLKKEKNTGEDANEEVKPAKQIIMMRTSTRSHTVLKKTDMKEAQAVETKDIKSRAPSKQLLALKNEKKTDDEVKADETKVIKAREDRMKLVGVTDKKKSEFALPQSLIDGPNFSVVLNVPPPKGSEPTTVVAAPPTTVAPSSVNRKPGRPPKKVLPKSGVSRPQKYRGPGRPPKFVTSKFRLARPTKKVAKNEKKVDSDSSQTTSAKRSTTETLADTKSQLHLKKKEKTTDDTKDDKTVKTLAITNTPLPLKEKEKAGGDTKEATIKRALARLSQSHPKKNEKADDNTEEVTIKKARTIAKSMPPPKKNEKNYDNTEEVAIKKTRALARSQSPPTKKEKTDDDKETKTKRTRTLAKSQPPLKITMKTEDTSKEANTVKTSDEGKKTMDSTPSTENRDGVRPPKKQTTSGTPSATAPLQVPRKRGRPPKLDKIKREMAEPATEKRGRGRPPKKETIMRREAEAAALKKKQEIDKKKKVAAK
ncbi:hypothetical protein PFISCL1PPCAC_24575, partial [Pristionchus fissidentatus]